MRTAIILTSFIIITIITAVIIRFSIAGKNNNTTDYMVERPLKAVSPREVQIIRSWNVPEILKEISGISYIDETTFACVQDELGKIFIFNTTSGRIEKEITFGQSGDYEGLALNGTTAYVLRADGQLFEIYNYMESHRKVVEHKTPLTQKQNTEGLALDKENNRLLISIKGPEPNSDDYKGVYAFDLNDHKMIAEPILNIDLTNKAFDQKKKDKKKGSRMQPSEIAIHPKNGNIYITDGAKPKLLIMDSTGKIISVTALNDKKFSQPEGIAFSPDGRLFISNEGTKKAGNILEIHVPN